MYQMIKQLTIPIAVPPILQKKPNIDWPEVCVYRVVRGRHYCLGRRVRIIWISLGEGWRVMCALRGRSCSWEKAQKWDAPPPPQENKGKEEGTKSNVPCLW